MIISPHDPTYPRRLLDLPEPPVITVSGEVDPTKPLDAGLSTIAIVGSRKASLEAVNWTHQLAYHLVRAGLVVVSGGAIGIDDHAHLGAMKGGSTWCVACGGRDAPPYPIVNDARFRAIERSPSSRMIWPFPSDQPKTPFTPRQRNKVLVALADATVVVQAGNHSGSLNAASFALYLGRPLYVAPGRPWDYPFQGSNKLILEGATPTYSIEHLFDELCLTRPDLDDPAAVFSGKLPRQPAIRSFKRRGRSLASDPHFHVDRSTLTHEQNVVISSMSRAPTHQDKIVAKSGLEVSATLTALLTLSLRDVVVEGPDGFFRLRTEP